MNPWVYVGAGVAALLVLVGLIVWIVHIRKARRRFAKELMANEAGLTELTERVNAVVADLIDHSPRVALVPHARLTGPGTVDPGPAAQTAPSAPEASRSSHEPRHALSVATLTELEAQETAVAVPAASEIVEVVEVVEPVVITTVSAVPGQRDPLVGALAPERGQREVELLSAVVASRPQWLPAKPLRESLIKTASFAHGVRHALSAEVRDRIAVEMQLEARRSRRQRKVEMKALRKYLRSRPPGRHLPPAADEAGR